MKTEIKVGLFVFLGLLSLFIITFQIKSLENLKEKGYTIYAEVADASGLNKKSRVKMRGVKIGYIDKMRLEDSVVLLKLKINKDVKIPVGSKVSVAQDNVLGGKYLKIIPSNSKEYYKPGAIIKNYVKTASMEDVMTNINLAVNDVRTLLAKLNRTLDEQTIQNLKQTVAYLKSSSKNLDSILARTNQKLPEILTNANKLLLSYKQTGDILKQRLPKLLDKVDTLVSNSNSLISTTKTKVSKLADEYIKVGQNVNDLLVKNKNALSETIVAAKDFFANGSSSFKKIDQFLGAVNKSQLVVDINTRYLTKDDDYNTIANIAYKPNPTKSYIIGISSRKDFSEPGESNNSKLYFNAEIAKRYDNIQVRGGIIENTGGVGLDYYLDHDKLKLSSEIYDFNSNNDYRGSKPHLNMYATYLYLKHIEILAGIDNILNTKPRSFFLGVGIKFKDNDLKPFLSGGASSLLK
jgi:phospholipid/cholesterol/gamma-HCH transport system substrate-binding protein